MVPTELTAEPSLLARKSTFWCVALLIAVLFSVANLPWTLDNYDQAKQAFTSYEMVTQGHWLYQHTPKGRLATKPPLVGWISAGVYALTRNWEIAWRLPSLGAALLLAFALTRSATKAYGAIAGTIALSAFGLNLLAPRLASLARTDMPLASVATLLGLKIWDKVRTGETWQRRDRLEMFALLTAALLIKGPIVYAFILPGLVAFECWRRAANAAHPHGWGGWWPWLLSAVIFLAWVLGGIWWIPWFYDEVVVREFAGRFGETIHQTQPLYFYVPHLLHKFAPWSVLSVALVVLAWRLGREPLRERLQRISADTAWLICWSIGGLLMMSVIPSKRVDRIFPIVPPLCLLLASVVSTLANVPKLRRTVLLWSGVALLVAAIGITTFTGYRVVSGYRGHNDALVRFGADVRRQAALKGWRYEVIGWREEGLLLYLRRDRFLEPKEAIARWAAGTLDAVVVPADDASALLTRMPGAVVSTRGEAISGVNPTRPYVLLTRG